MNSAFGDGLTQEELTGSLGNRKADLLIKMIPAEKIENKICDYLIAVDQILSIPHD